MDRITPFALSLLAPPRELGDLLDDPDPEADPKTTFPLMFTFALPCSFKSFDLSSSTTNSLKNSTVASTSEYVLASTAVPSPFLPAIPFIPFIRELTPNAPNAPEPERPEPPSSPARKKTDGKVGNTP